MSFHDGPIHTKVGLCVSTGKYVTVEKFGDQISAVAPALKPKQTFRVEIADGHYFLKTWHGKYLAADELGKVTASSEAKGKNEQWNIEFANGPVHIRSAHGKYLEPSGDSIKASGAAPSAATAISLQLAVHPQVCFQNYEERYMMTQESGNVTCPNHFQQGIGTLFTLVYVANGAYALWSGLNGKFVSVDASGNCVSSGAAATPDCCFVFEWVEDKVAIKSVGNGKYLTVEGTDGQTKAKKDKITQREKWVIMDSHAQVTVLAHNGKFVGIQEATVICQQPEAAANETFLLETEGDKIALRSSTGRYISHKAGTIANVGEGRNADTTFTLEYPAFGRVAFKTPDGKYLASKKLGGVYLKAGADEETVFVLRLLNRPVIALQSKAFNTFVGTSNGKYVTHKATVETFATDYENGTYAFRGSDGAYFSVNGSNVVPGSRTFFELRYLPGSLCLIRTADGKNLSAEQHGGFIVSNESGDKEQFEF